jgi:NADH-quinone oxidoreductase subunit N
MYASAFPITLILPEFIIGAGALALTLFGAFHGRTRSWLITEMAIALLGVAFLLLLFQRHTPALAFGGLFVDDAFARFMKALAILGSLVALLLSIDFMREEKIEGFEYSILILLSTLGMMMLISATNLIALYLGLELMSLALYVVAAFHRDDLRATEAGLKYFVLGALSSGMLLYGASLLYGYSGSVSFKGIALAIQGEASLGAIFGLVFVMAGLAFKMSAVPFHMWTPDVYEGAPTPVTAFFASAPKMAAVAVTVRLIVTAFPGITGQWQQIIIFISIASMGLGAFAAIGQANIKRLMAYSSIGHMGFALVGLSAGSNEGVRGVAIYMMIYLIMTLGTFAAILSMRVGGKAVENVSDLAGLSKTNPTMAFFLAVMMFSLMGMPPLAGFFAKFYVLVAAVKAGLYPLAVLGMIASVIAAFYYLRIVKVMYLDAPAAAFDKPKWAEAGVLALSGVLNLAFWLYPAPFVTAAEAAAQALF